MTHVARSAEEFRRIERIALRAWPSAETVEYDGWVLRASGGYTKRANSVNPHFGSSLPLTEKLEHCRAFYTERELPTIFRLTPFSEPRELDGVLANAGYTTLDPTVVMTARLNRSLSLNPEVQPVGLEIWVDAFNRLKQPEPAMREAHRRIVVAAEGDHRFAIVKRDSVPAACGLGVLIDDVVGVFDLFTAELHRQQGLGSAVVGSILGWARDHGARTAFLQVHSKNDPAIRLYGQFGFEIAYPYWYRIAPDLESTPPAQSPL